MKPKSEINLTIQWEKFTEETVILSVAELHLWLVSLQQPEKKLALLRKLLSEPEKSRADRFIFAKHRRRYTASQAHLRILLSKYIAIPPADISFEVGEYGKPFIEPPIVQFNMSRSDDYALYGFVLNGDLGVDIEQWRERIHSDGIIKHNFSVQEKMDYQELPDELKTAGFYKGWTCKEAFIKAIGKGLYFPLDLFSICMDPRQAAKLIAVEDEYLDAKDWHLFTIPMEENFSAAFAINREVRKVRAFIL